MTREELIKNCRYYKGESICPFHADDGRSVWWRIEMNGVDAQDKTDLCLSKNMLAYIKNRIWETDCGGMVDLSRHLTWKEAKARANELYTLGKWSAGYLWDKECPLSNAY